VNGFTTSGTTNYSTLHHSHKAEVRVYAQSDESKRLHSGQLFQWSHRTDLVPACTVPANILELLKDQVLCREIGPPLAQVRSPAVSLWSFLRLLGGEWIWEEVKEGDTDVDWIRDALTNGTFVGVTDGSYNREKPKKVCRSGWIMVCTTSRCTLRGSFFEISTKAGLYRGEMLGLVALHTIVTAVAQFFGLDQVTG
jgi:hypothetical protein